MKLLKLASPLLVCLGLLFPSTLAKAGAIEDGERFFEAGMGQLYLGNYAEGIRLLRQSVEHLPTQNTLYNIGLAERCWVKVAENPEAVVPGCVSMTAGGNPPAALIEIHLQARAEFKEGLVAINAGDYPAGIEHFGNANRIAPHPDTAQNLFRAQKCWVTLSDPTRENVDGCVAISNGVMAPPELITNFNEARRLSEEGLGFVTAGNYAAGVDRLNRSNSLLSHPDTTFNIQMALDCWRRASLSSTGNLGSCRAISAGGRARNLRVPSLSASDLNIAVVRFEEQRLEERRRIENPSIKCDLVEVARRDHSEGSFLRNRVQPPIAFGNRQEPIWDPEPQLNLSNGTRIKIVTRTPPRRTDPWSMAVEFSQTSRVSTLDRFISLPLTSSGSCVTNARQIRMAVSNASTQVLSEVSSLNMEFSDSVLRPGQRSPKQRRCLVFTDPGPKFAQKYYDLSCQMTRRRPTTAVVTPGTLTIEPPQATSGTK